MFLSPLLAALLTFAAGPNPDPTLAVTAHPFGLLVFPLVGDEEETIMHVQLDVDHKPAARLTPVGHLAVTMLSEVPANALDVRITVFDAQGSLVGSARTQGASGSLDLAQAKSGIHFVHFQSGSTRVAMSLVIP